MMKKFVTGLLSVLLLLALAPVAKADMLWSPGNNNFYSEHYEDCTYIGRAYYANGKKGFVTLWDAPKGTAVVQQYENGVKLWVYWQYEDWGCINVTDDPHSTFEVVGWVPLSDLYLIYDYISFEEEFSEQFQPYNGEFDGYSDTSGKFVFWNYPNGPHYDKPKHTDLITGLNGSDGKSSISQVYIDQNGQHWGYVNYLFGYRNFWINMDNPEGEGVMDSCIPEVDDLIHSGELIPPKTPVRPTVSTVPFLLVGGVVIITVALLILFYRKNKKPNN